MNYVSVLFSLWYYYSFSTPPKKHMSWQDVFTAKGLEGCAKFVKKEDVTRWEEGGVTLHQELPEMLDMVLQDADTRKTFASGNMMLAAKLNQAAAKTQPEVKNEKIVGLGQEEAGYAWTGLQRFPGRQLAAR